MVPASVGFEWDRGSESLAERANLLAKGARRWIAERPPKASAGHDWGCLTVPRNPAYSAVEGIFSPAARNEFMAKGNFGERLKRERELREVSQEELTTGTRINARYLEALENEEWDKLPGGAFCRGFVRSIAKYLGLNEENFLAEYDLARGEQSVPVPHPYENKIPRPPIWIPVALMLGVLLILAGLVAGGVYGWRKYAAHRAAKRSSSTTSVSAPAGPNGAASGESGVDVPAEPVSARDPGSNSDGDDASVPLDLAVSTSAAARVRILGDGAVLLDAQLPAGETRHFSAGDHFEVTVGDSSAVLLELNGKAMPPVAAPGASGTIVLSHKDLRQAPVGTSQP
jgi:cytoskeleton protein RodZ